MRAQCCICADLFENSASVNIAASPCGHTFHEVCLMRWMDTSSTCPSCRTHIKKNQIIKRLFFDIAEDVDEEENVDRLVNQIGTLKAQVRERDKEKHELAEERDHLTALLAACESTKDDLTIKLNDERNIRDVMERDLRLLRKENAAYIAEMKEFRKTQRKLQELQNVETVLKGCDSDVQEMVSQYAEGGESSIKQLASLVTVMKREYNQVLSDKKALREQVSKLKHSMGHYHSETKRAKREVLELRGSLDKVSEDLSKMEKKNNKNRRKLVLLRNSVLRDKIKGSQSFHQALNEDSPNVAYTPPKPTRFAGNREENEENLDVSPFKNACMTPDLFDDSPVANKASQNREKSEEREGTKLKLVQVPTAAENLQATKRAKLDDEAENEPELPLGMFSIMKKKMTGQSNAGSHLLSMITQGYDGMGSSTTFVHPQGRQKVASSLKMLPKKKTVKGTFRADAKTLINQPRIKDCRQLFSSSSSASSSSSSLSSAGQRHEASVVSVTNEKGSAKSKSKNFFKSISSKASVSSSVVPKLSSDACGIIDLT